MQNNVHLDGIAFSKMIIKGSSNFKAHIKEINELNVFPIPDGDTGDNMYMTLSGGLEKIVSLKSNSISEVASALASGMILSARGNSGVIFSQLFAGFSKGLSDKGSVTLKEVCSALKTAVKQGYAAVSHPVEGTMLTVAREAVEKANSISDTEDVELFTKLCLEEVKRSLDRTPELLPTLKEAGVVDSGGAGLYYFIQGMMKSDDVTALDELAFTASPSEVDFSKFNEDSVMEYGYCTECLLRLQSIKVDVQNFDIRVIKDYLESIGDSVVIFKTDSIVKLHVHTFTPYKVLEFCHKFGEFLTLKIENMTLQHNGTKKESEKAFTKKRPRKKFGLVTVALGKGLTDVFYELGADVVINGGQTKNPSVEDFLKAFDETNADEIFVLPNNSNIIMAAQKASELYRGSKIYVIKTKSLGQAYSILSMLDYSSNDGELIAGGMNSDMEGTITASITSSVRDANINGIDIKRGDYIGFTDKEMKVSSPNKLETLEGLLETLNLKDKYFLIAVYGENVTEDEKLKAKQIVNSKYSNLEFYEINGGQEVYDYILILE